MTRASTAPLTEKPSRKAEWLDATQVGDELGVSPSCIRSWVRQGKGPRAFQPGRRGALRFRREDVDAWIELNSREGASA